VEQQKESAMRGIAVIFVTVFLAELGDKTQLATLLFASNQNAPSPWLVFAGAAGALVLSTAIAVALGTAAERYLTIVPLKLIAGIGFIVIGIWTVTTHFRGA
jgi:putative Ca2+/H+ antiporter (TMEM165/GDT1 family)